MSDVKKIAEECLAMANDYLPEYDFIETDISMKSLKQLSEAYLELEQKLSVAREALEFYADEENWEYCHLPGSGLGRTVLTKDSEKRISNLDQYYMGSYSGKRAREALAAIDKGDE